MKSKKGNPRFEAAVMRLQGREQVAQNPKSRLWHAVDRGLGMVLSPGFPSQDEARRAWRELIAADICCRSDAASELDCGLVE